MTTPEFCMYFCFTYWAIGTAITIIGGALRPRWVNFYPGRKLNLYHPYDFIMVTTILAWIAMWCFRSLY